MLYERPALTPLPVLTERDVLDWRIKRLIGKVCLAHGDVRVHLHDLSRQLRVTPSHIGKRFKQQHGVGFRTFSTLKRDEYVCELLRGTDLPIKEIAARSGYKQVCDLTHRFRQLHSVSPTEYRSQFRIVQLANEKEI